MKKRGYSKLAIASLVLSLIPLINFLLLMANASLNPRGSFGFILQPILILSPIILIISITLSLVSFSEIKKRNLNGFMFMISAFFISIISLVCSYFLLRAFIM
jgi:hypothetical protein